ncbi:MAG TPA: glycosyltransferase [Chlamydiales bacterium]|nr:glycosyltransferase [Chlamydiales bacterium]
MKILRISGMHYAKARSLPYECDLCLSSMPYQEQLRRFCLSFLHYGDSLTFCLQKYGYEGLEILYDVERLQKKWAEENNCFYSHDNWQEEILFHQIQKIKPDILFLQNAQTPSFDIMKRRKDFFPFLKRLIVFRGYPETNRELLDYLSLADMVLIGSPKLDKICRRNHLKPHLFPHYFDDRILNCLEEKPDKYDVTFLGSSGYGFGWVHQPRYYYLNELLKETKIECWLEETVMGSSRWKEKTKRICETFISHLPDLILQKIHESQMSHPSLQKLAFNGLARKESIRCKSTIFPDIPLGQLFPDQCHPPVFGLDMYQKLAGSKISFNKHTFAASGTVDNIRLFQATGVGSCLLTDFGSNLPELFEADSEVVTYSSIDECLEKMRYLLENESTRKRIAVNGQKRTLRDHTASCRALQLHDLIEAQ